MLWIMANNVHSLKINKSLLLLPLLLCVNFCFSQSISAFRSNGKWGFKEGDKITIEAQYDTVFGFDVTHRICLVGKINPLKRSINSLTHEVHIDYTYNYITPANKKICGKISETQNEICDFTATKDMVSQYITDKNYFITHYNGKEIVFNKNGKQLTDHPYDNVSYTKVDSFFMVETKDPKSGHGFLGLINTSGKQVIPSTYSKISFNTYDTLIYCCTAGIRFNGSDDVYNYKGEKLHSHSKHIQCASKNFTIFKLFESENSYVIFDNKTLKEKQIKAEYVYYLKDDNIVLLDGDWFFYNLATEKKTPIDKKIIKYLHLDD